VSAAEVGAWHKRLYKQLTLLGGASRLGAAVTARKFFDASRGIDEFLLAREKRVAGGADADFNVSPRRTGMIHRAACANDVGLYVFRMNVRFHVRKGARNLRGMGDFRKR
jgi:hypothetical protein